MSTTNITSPVGRLIRGAVDALRDKKDNLGNVKLGKDQQPMKEVFFELAIPKAGEAHWNQTAWGAQIWAIGAASSPQMHQNPAFAWKITDGDSAVPNRKNKVPNQQANYPGNWIIKFSSGFIPNRYRRNAAGALEQIIESGMFKLGYWAQVSIRCQGNGSTESPGVYLNPDMVCFSGYGEEIYVGPDAESAGFGAAPMPAGVMAAPAAGMVMPAAPGAPGLPPTFVPPVPVAAPAYAPGGAPASAPAYAPPPPVPAPAAVNPTLMPVPGAAYTIEQLRAQQWSDDQIVQGGYATRIAAAPAPLPPSFSAPAPVAPAAPIAPVAVVPNPAFVQIPPPGAGIIMNPGAGTYEQFRAANWSDEQIIAAGHGRRA